VYLVGVMCVVNLLVMFYELGRYVMLLLKRTYNKMFPPPKEPVWEAQTPVQVIVHNHPINVMQIMR
jgi:hypothetical protein